MSWRSCDITVMWDHGSVGRRRHAIITLNGDPCYWAANVCHSIERSLNQYFTPVSCVVCGMAECILWHLIYFRSWCNELFTGIFTVYRILMIRFGNADCGMIFTGKIPIKWLGGWVVEWRWVVYVRLLATLLKNVLTDSDKIINICHKWHEEHLVRHLKIQMIVIRLRSEQMN